MICEVQPEGLESRSQVRNTQCSYFISVCLFYKKTNATTQFEYFLGEIIFFPPTVHGIFHENGAFNWRQFVTCQFLVK